MISKTITYRDFNGIERSGEFHFHIGPDELLRMQIEHGGDLAEYLTKIGESEDGPTVYKEFEKIVLSSYGVKSQDGHSFEQYTEDGKRLGNTFRNHAACRELLVELTLDAEMAHQFVRGILPGKEVMDDVRKRAEAIAARQVATPEGQIEAAIANASPDNAVNSITAVSPTPVDTVKPENPENPEKEFADYTEAELLAMSADDFYKVVPKNPQEMTREQMVVAMKRKN